VTSTSSAGCTSARLTLAVECVVEQLRPTVALAGRAAVICLTAELRRRVDVLGRLTALEAAGAVVTDRRLTRTRT
jgi:hypothetical protein